MSLPSLLLERIRRRLLRRYRSLRAWLLIWHTRQQLQRLPLQQILQRKALLGVKDRNDLAALRQDLHKFLWNDSNPCLPRSIILFQQLRALGQQPSLVMGAAHNSLPGAAPLRAHAWVELQGIPYAEPEGFSPQLWLETFRFPALNSVTKATD